MATSTKTLSQEELKLRWQERCRAGNFSASVLGLGTVRVFGKSGDAPVTFPRIESLAALEQLSPDERWAVEQAQNIVTAAQRGRRPVLATQPPQGGSLPSPTPVQTFDPRAENILVLSLTRGG